MKPSKHLPWLYEQLPELVNSGVLSAEAAERLRTHYGEIPRRDRLRLALIACSILGALLVGLGIILLFAHNWEDLTRPMRTALSFAPMVLGQVLAGYTLARQKHVLAWSEGAGIFLTLAIGASIALVAQTYHLSDDPAAFMLTWMLLSLPLVYLLEASAPALIYLWGITTWAENSQSEYGHAFWFWLLFIAVLPHYWQIVRADRASSRSALLGWGLALCLCIAPGIALEHAVPGLWIVTYTALFSALWLAGWKWFDDVPSLWQRAFQIVGGGGALVLSFILTYSWPWKEIGWRHLREGAGYQEFGVFMDCLIAAAFFALSLYLLSRTFSGLNRIQVFVAIIPVLTLVAFTLTSLDVNKIVLTVSFNFIVLAAGVITMQEGIQKENLGMVNLGMLIISALIVMRFFESEWSFLTRGLVFIALGAGFLVTNWIIIRRGQRA